MEPVLKRIDSTTWVRYSDYLALKHELDAKNEMYLKLDAERAGLLDAYKDQKATIKNLEAKLTRATETPTGPVPN